MGDEISSKITSLQLQGLHGGGPGGGGRGGGAPNRQAHSYHMYVDQIFIRNTKSHPVDSAQGLRPGHPCMSYIEKSQTRENMLQST